MIETTFVGGINPFLPKPPPPREPYVRVAEPHKKTHPLYMWVRDNPRKTYTEIANATGRTRDAVKRIAVRMAAYNLVVLEQCPLASVRLNRVRIA